MAIFDGYFRWRADCTVSTEHIEVRVPVKGLLGLAFEGATEKASDVAEWLPTQQGRAFPSVARLIS